jgi:hypothetical protein
MVSMTLAVCSLHRVVPPIDCARFALDFRFRDGKTEALRMGLMKHPSKKGKFVPRDKDDVFLHFPVRSQLVLGVDFLGNGRRRAATNVLLVGQKVVRSGKYFAFFSQNPRSNCFVKKRGLLPCLSIRLKSVEVRELPEFLICWNVAVEWIVAFRRIISDFEVTQILSLFGVILNNKELMDKFDKETRRSIKRIPRQRRALEQKDVFVEHMCRVVVDSSEFRPPPFTTDEIAAMRPDIHVRGWVPGKSAPIKINEPSRRRSDQKPTKRDFAV